MLTRRDLIRLGLLSGGALLMGSRRAAAGIPSSFWDDPKSPTLTPFVQPLPRPRVVTRTSLAGLSPRAQTELQSLPAAAQMSTKMHGLVVEEAAVSLHPDLPPTRIWRYRDVNTPAGVADPANPMFKVRMGDPQAARFVNRLPRDHVGFGSTDLTTHLHGVHTFSASDGFPGPIQAFGFDPLFAPRGDPQHPAHYDYIYAMQDVGYSTGNPEPGERPSTLWYHDHKLDHTGANVYRGLAGFYLVFDELDSDDENDPSPQALRLPSGRYDIPLILIDKLIAPNGQLLYMPDSFDGHLGDSFTVNGVVQPYLNVSARKYRFRLLNGSNARMYQLFLVTPGGSKQPFDIIATDGGLTSVPLRDEQTFLLSMASRREIVVDFSKYPPGTELYLEDRIVQDDGRGPDGKFDDIDLTTPGIRLMKFIVGQPATDNSQVPDVLRPFAKITSAEIASATRREIEFERKNGSWVINDKAVDLQKAVEKPKIGQPYIWRLVNKSGGWWHPIHVHLEFFRFLSRDTGLPFIERDGIARYDTAVLGPNSEVEVFFRFRDFAGPFVFHCHNLEHEDHYMMARFDVT